MTKHTPLLDSSSKCELFQRVRERQDLKIRGTVRVSEEPLRPCTGTPYRDNGFSALYRSQSTFKFALFLSDWLSRKDTHQPLPAATTPPSQGSPPEDETNPKKDRPEKSKKDTFRTIFCKRQPDPTDLTPDRALYVSVTSLGYEPFLPKQSEPGFYNMHRRVRSNTRATCTAATASAVLATLGFPTGTLEQWNGVISGVASESQHSLRDFREDM